MVWIGTSKIFKKMFNGLRKAASFIGFFIIPLVLMGLLRFLQSINISDDLMVWIILIVMTLFAHFWSVLMMKIE